MHALSHAPISIGVSRIFFEVLNGVEERIVPAFPKRTIQDFKKVLCVFEIQARSVLQHQSRLQKKFLPKSKRRHSGIFYHSEPYAFFNVWFVRTLSGHRCRSPFSVYRPQSSYSQILVSWTRWCVNFRHDVSAPKCLKNTKQLLLSPTLVNVL